MTTLERLQTIFSDPDMRGQAITGYAYTFHQLGWPARAHEMGYAITEMALAARDLQQVEQDIHKLLLAEKRLVEDTATRKRDQISVVDAFNQALNKRRAEIYSKLNTFVVLPYSAQQRTRLRVLDYGSGNGKLGEYLNRHGVTNIDSYDQDPFPGAENVKRLLGVRMPEIADNTYNLSFAFNILHHWGVAQGAISEMARVTSGDIVLLETTPDREIVETGDQTQIAREKDRLFAVDWLTRLIHPDANVPHAGDYKTCEEWARMLSATKFGSREYNISYVQLMRRTHCFDMPQSIIYAKKIRNR